MTTTRARAVRRGGHLQTHPPTAMVAVGQGCNLFEQHDVSGNTQSVDVVTTTSNMRAATIQESDDNVSTNGNTTTINANTYPSTAKRVKLKRRSCVITASEENPASKKAYDGNKALDARKMFKKRWRDLSDEDKCLCMLDGLNVAMPEVGDTVSHHGVVASSTSVGDSNALSTASRMTTRSRSTDEQMQKVKNEVIALIARFIETNKHDGQTHYDCILLTIEVSRLVLKFAEDRVADIVAKIRPTLKNSDIKSYKKLVAIAVNNLWASLDDEYSSATVAQLENINPTPSYVIDLLMSKEIKKDAKNANTTAVHKVNESLRKLKTPMKSLAQDTIEEIAKQLESCTKDDEKTEFLLGFVKRYLEKKTVNFKLPIQSCTTVCFIRCWRICGRQ